MESHAMLLPFDTDSAEFVRGFELGRLWAILRADPAEPVEEYAHAANAEMLLRLAEATGRDVQSEETDSDWLIVRFSRAKVDISEQA